MKFTALHVRVLQKIIFLPRDQSPSRFCLHISHSPLQQLDESFAGGREINVEHLGGFRGGLVKNALGVHNVDVIINNAFQSHHCPGRCIQDVLGFHHFFFRTSRADFGHTNNPILLRIPVSSAHPLIYILLCQIFRLHSKT